MPGLPININDLVNATTVESERIEYKESWNPEDIMHSLCAFANDFHNLGGGYIIVGIAEKNGLPVLPPKGLVPEQVDTCQKKLLELSRKIIPSYFPVSSVEFYQGKHILVLWATGGDNRPYKCPKNLVPNPTYNYYIRKSSNSVMATPDEERQLYELANRIPFDDRINHSASIEDLKLPLILSFLKEVGSELYQRASSIPFPELCQQLQIVKGSSEYLRPVNVGLLLFNDHPTNIFRGAKIEIVRYLDPIGDELEERIFEGPVHLQLRSALQFIQNTIIAERVKKIPNQAEARRFYNYPYAAIEEALANAVFHRSYELDNPVEVNIRLDRIEILSFPGPVPPVDKDDLKKDRIVARSYRNRRIGDFLKELRLTEGRGTGIPKIRRTMLLNDSPAPIFETDEARNYFLVTLPIHESFLPLNDEPDLEGSFIDFAKDVLALCRVPHSRLEILRSLGVNTGAASYRKYILPLLQLELLRLTIPDKPSSKNQKYLITNAGKAMLQKLS
ncbi:putative DNA binding domain-containing protein [Pontibacter sp. JH31]|uniref:DNA binding domain-containing protein n=1 Tax=Pontibacter aquaedesilientis TaxID=2766980 RepID=A0ABR7XL88_9BACT|nr:RNA-binding domain-containing protein [Pontibacter aquaedesilientis]MBD1399039.1 putative DNA binding domain-containing protein [Pontibacter aquaedesilientis]